jgi:hypothetical protein
MSKTKSTSFFKLLFFPPKQDVINIVVERKNSVVIFIPIAFGILIGFIRAVSKYDTAYPIEFFYGQLVAGIGFSVSITLVVLFLYVLLIQFFSSVFKGISNYKMTFTMFSYSLLPIIIGWILMLAVSMIIKFIPIGYVNSVISVKVLNVIQMIFILYGIVILVRGVSIINQFSIIKSLISSVGLFIILFIIGIFQKVV